MAASLPGRRIAGPIRVRIASVLGRGRLVAPVAPPRRSLLSRWGPQGSTDEPVYFAVRSIGPAPGGHMLEYAFVDDRGSLVLDARIASPCTEGEDVGAFGDHVARTCRGADLVAYHRVLQSGLLPPGALAGAAGVACAWRRFRKVARARGLRLDPDEPLSLADCLVLAGLPARPLGDAAARALAVRTLWRWMDGAP